MRGTRVPLLGLVDLGFHELGHLLTYPFPDVVTASMGSVAQVAVPAGIAAYFFAVRGDRLGGSLCLGWAGASAADVAVYIADAPTENLVLLGEGEHDWAFVLGPSTWTRWTKPPPSRHWSRAWGSSSCWRAWPCAAGSS